MERLSDNTLEILKPIAAKPDYDRSGLGIGIVSKIKRQAIALLASLKRRSAHVLNPKRSWRG